ncbi:hypothetical protein [Reinekea sp. G2M2-21]|uniref:hypothetical protein n=1 Tax=Reinekea sp. G2M2-21 TaxID=2788942 RepID=UPI0018AB9006|nr:hypothetical protein [Reinekea sp. G2M2-21]
MYNHKNNFGWPEMVGKYESMNNGNEFGISYFITLPCQTEALNFTKRPIHNKLDYPMNAGTATMEAYGENKTWNWSGDEQFKAVFEIARCFLAERAEATEQSMEKMLTDTPWQENGALSFGVYSIDCKIYDDRFLNAYLELSDLLSPSFDEAALTLTFYNDGGYERWVMNERRLYVRSLAEFKEALLSYAKEFAPATQAAA